ncbi:hypothetical protein F25303_8281 [Fusarium sp. NRRL 25303]|nr:hypothetical protein F25303_8281 [Fusarium sp. NRRL 25303]
MGNLPSEAPMARTSLRTNRYHLARFRAQDTVWQSYGQPHIPPTIRSFDFPSLGYVENGYFIPSTSHFDNHGTVLSSSHMLSAPVYQSQDGATPLTAETELRPQRPGVSKNPRTALPIAVDGFGETLQPHASLVSGIPRENFSSDPESSLNASSPAVDVASTVETIENRREGEDEQDEDQKEETRPTAVRSVLLSPVGQPTLIHLPARPQVSPGQQVLGSPQSDS